MHVQIGVFGCRRCLGGQLCGVAVVSWVFVVAVAVMGALVAVYGVCVVAVSVVVFA